MEEKTAKSKRVPQVFIVGINVFSWVCAALMGVYAVVYAIWALAQGGHVGGMLAYNSLTISVSALALGLVALFTNKKITDKEMLKKACGVAAAFLLVGAILYAAVALSTALYGLFAVGASGVSQQAIWVDAFLPKLGMAVAAVGMLFVVKQVRDGMTKLLPIMFYSILAVAGLAIVLSIVATFVGLYGGSGSSSVCIGDYCATYKY